jgi:hypothetical protein
VEGVTSSDAPHTLHINSVTTAHRLEAIAVRADPAWLRWLHAIHAFAPPKAPRPPAKAARSEPNPLGPGVDQQCHVRRTKPGGSSCF